MVNRKIFIVGFGLYGSIQGATEYAVNMQVMMGVHWKEDNDDDDDCVKKKMKMMTRSRNKNWGVWETDEKFGDEWMKKIMMNGELMLIMMINEELI